MRDGDDGLALDEAPERVLDRGLGLAVERRGRLVEHEDRRVLEDDARERHALALPARELHPPLADMGIIAAPPLGIGEIEDEAVGVRGMRGGEHLGLGRIGAAIEEVVAHRAVQERRLLLDHADAGAQAGLLDRADVLPVDEDAAALGLVKAQEQLHERRFPRPRAAHDADLLAGADRQVDAMEPPAPAAAIAVAEPAQLDRAAHPVDRAGARRIGERDRLGDGLEPLGDDTERAEEPRQRPHDPARHRIEPQRERGRGRHRADARLPLHPEPERPARDRDDEKAVERDERDIHEGIEPHLMGEGAAGGLDRLAGIGKLAVVMGEKLDRMDVRIAVDDPPRHGAAGVRARLRGGADARHRPAHKEPVEGKPDEQRQREPRVGIGQQHRRPEDVGDREGDRIEDLKDRIARRRWRLHHAVGDAAGKVVLEPADRLAQHLRMAPPAIERAIVGQHRVVEQQRVQRLQRRAQHQHEHPRRDELGAMRGPDLGR